ncbi:MAG: hypothetical protein KGJ60_10420 [Verrucomicrobiota bacterium]|nr:hypothetical protein [Verrucomicrobiota bacterium]
MTNDYGAVTSAMASLTVYTNVVITTDISPLNVTLFAGGHATFSIVAQGSQPIGYQWYSNSVAVSGATNSSFLLSDVQANTAVQCVATNSFNSVSSSTANVTVLPAPTASYPKTILANNPVGFWRLNETNNPNGNDGTVAHDYWGGNNGTYTNVTLEQAGYNPTGEPSETSAQFGFLSFSNSMVFDIPSSVGFGAPSTSNSSFTIECWVNGYGQTADAGIVSKGTGGGGEQFDLDTGANDPAHDFRFFVRDASGATHGVGSTNAPDGAWHYLAAVCDEADGYVALYVDGILVGTNTITPGSGILASSQSLKIGSRPSGSNPNANANQFAGNIDDVAVYNYALTPAQVQNDFNSADIPARIAGQPANLVADENGTATFSAVVEGTPPLTNQWYSNSVAISGATNSTLVLNNVSTSANESSYYLTTANAFGQDQSLPATLTVVSGAPQIQPYGQDVQSPFFAPQGGSGSDSFTVYGTEPISYQWQFYSGGAWANLTDGSGITGSQSNVLTIANAQTSEAGSYRAIAQNASGSATSSVAIFNVGTPIEFYPGFWQANGVATFATNTLTLTTQSGGGISSYFFKIPQSVGAFDASWTYVNVSGTGVANATADGFAFVMQNDPAGVNAIGGGGSALGYADPPITPSAELCFELYNNSDNAPGMAWATGGAPSAGVTSGGFMYNSVSPVNLLTNSPIDFNVHYDGNVLALAMTDEVTQATFSTNVVVGSIPQTVGGDTAYIGFTAACGGVTTTQVITNFSFASINIPVASISAASTNVVISWSAAITGYTLQENSDLSTANWVDVTNAVSVANGQNQVTVPLTSTNEFFRLKLQ